jgi:hypothetical protein
MKEKEGHSGSEKKVDRREESGLQFYTSNFKYLVAYIYMYAII